MTDEQTTQSSQENTATTGNNAQGTTQGDSASNLTQIQTELEEAKNKLQDMTIIAQRALADLQNFKRRSEEEKSSFITFANAALLSELVPVIDNTHRALQHEPKDLDWTKGVEQTLRQFLQILEKIGISVIPTIDQTFDPTLHEALLAAPGEKDKILEELEKGYTLHDKVLKRARVKVGNGEEAQS